MKRQEFQLGEPVRQSRLPALRFDLQFLRKTVTVLILLPFVFYTIRLLLRPLPTQKTQQLFQGITYERQFRTDPRPLLLHIVTIDLTTPGLKLLVTPANADSTQRFDQTLISGEETEIAAQTTSQFLREFGLKLAINANFFHPFREKTPWDYYPHTGDRVNILGQATANGITYSPIEYPWPTLCLSAQNRATIIDHGAIRDGATCSPDTVQAISGSQPLM
jgi:hypothetical protein